MNRILPVLLVVAVSACDRSSKAPPPPDPVRVESYAESRFTPEVGTKGMVVADDVVAAAWGAEILRRGGNAIDAAVAVGFAMSVTRPQHSSIGGGGFMIYCPKKGPQGPVPCTVIDHREKAPARAHREMYVVDGKPRTDLSQTGALASGVPGVVAGLLTAHEKFGVRPRAELMSRAIELATNGVRFTGMLEDAARDQYESFNPEAKRILGCGHKDRPCAVGSILKQPELARVLREISTKGKDGFYRGWVAQKIVDGLKSSGGILSLEDMAQYAPAIREPVTGSFRGYEVVSMPPPSAGGTVLLEMLRMTEYGADSGELRDGFASARAIHAIAHGMGLAFSDRARFFGDPDFVQVPVKELLDEKKLFERWKKTFRRNRVNLPRKEKVLAEEGTHTTHYSIVDSQGNAVAITTTINENFGSGFIPPGTGIVMNNEMDDFSIQPGVPNLFGLIGMESNSVQPKKRPLSSMTPTIVRDDKGEVRLVLGGAGGPRITTAVFQVILNRLLFGMALPDAMAAPRFHHQWVPERLFVEKFGFPVEVTRALSRKGHELKETEGVAVVHALERFPSGRVWGAPDRRGEGAAVAE